MRYVKGKQVVARYNQGREVVRTYDHGRLVYESSIPDYLCFTALESGTFTLTVPAAVTSSYLSYVEWSKDGRTWNHTDISSSIDTINVDVVQGDKVYWRGSGACTTSASISTGRQSIFSSTARFDASGRVMSLLKGDNCANYDHLERNTVDGCLNVTFARLFDGCTTLVGASSLVLPTFTSWHTYIFSNLFAGCTSLTTAPELPSTALATSCYNSMFYGCTSLTATPTLPATNLAADCYYYMFRGCTNLVTATSLPATILASNCYHSMFVNCTSLETGFVLPATILANSSYYQMFYGCTHLKYVKCLATDISATNCITNWLYNVSSTGTFIQASGVTWPRGASGIPTGWLAYDEGEDIPNDYTMCDYIYNSSTGGNGVDLGFVFNTKNNSLEVKFKQDEISNGMPCGSRDGDGKIWLYNYEAVNRFAIFIKPVAVAQIVFYVYDPLDTDTHIVKYVGDGDDQYCYHNGELKAHGTRTDLSDTCPYNFYIFGRPANGYKGRIYYLWVKDTDTNEYICDLVPCSRNSDGAAGFWDTAQKQFFTSTYWTAHFDNE